MKIGIFGGTFNPIHKAHIELVKKAKNELKLDIVYVVPNYKSPVKKIEVEKIKPSLKYKMVEETIKAENLPWLKISNFEYKNKEQSYTYKTINYFKNKYPNSELFLLIGEDQYFSLENWKNVDQIFANSNIVVVRRTDSNKNIFNKYKNKIIYINDFYWPVSSTQLLKNSDWDKIPSAAKKIIAKHNLYLKTTTYLSLYEKRYEHSLSVATHAMRLAKKNRMLNYKKAYFAGLVHDLFKYMPIDEQQQYVTLNSDYVGIPSKALHGYVCALWLQNEYGMKDKQIIEAVKKHTLASSKMSKLDKIIYVADKIANDRKDVDSKRFRKMAYKNLNFTFANLLKFQINLLEKKGIEPHEETISAYNRYYLKNKGSQKYYGDLKKIK